VNKAVFRRFVEFTPVIVIFAADRRAILVNRAGSTGQDMLATALNQQVPAAVILVEFNMFMRDLP
jgi:chloramphenicol 3-O-phosphotransferase